METWSKKQLNKLISEYPTCEDTRVLADKIGKTYTALKSKATILGLKRTYQLWTPEMDHYLKVHYPHATIPVLLSWINKLRPQITESSVSARAFKLGLSKSAEFKSAQGKILKANHPTWNKGLKGYHAPGSEKGWFKKGGLPHTTLHDGAVTIRYEKMKNGQKRPYQWVRISKAKWKQLHVINWEKENGPVPNGHIVVFKDGNSLNADPKNLECITKAENVLRNSIHHYPTEVKEIIKLQSKINSKLKKIHQ